MVAADPGFFQVLYFDFSRTVGGPIMSILKPHVSLNVHDITKSVEFYEKVFGVRAFKRRPGYAKFDLTEPALNLTMQEAPRTGINASHFGVQCETAADVGAA